MRAWDLSPFPATCRAGFGDILTTHRHNIVRRGSLWGKIAVFFYVGKFALRGSILASEQTIQPNERRSRWQLFEFVASLHIQLVMFVRLVLTGVKITLPT